MVWIRTLLAALLLALVPQLASAHGGHDQPSPAASASREVAVAVSLQAGSIGPSLSPSCPGTPGGKCCCGALALAGAAKPPSVHAGAWALVLAPAAGATRFASLSLAPIAARPLHQARPRAPPASS